MTSGRFGCWSAFLQIVPILLVTLCGSASAAPPLPDLSTITVPDVTATTDPNVLKDGLKFFYFHKPGVSFAEALVDLTACHRLAQTGAKTSVPGFIPFGEERNRERLVSGDPAPSQFGLIGSLIIGNVEEKALRATWNTRMRRCMEPRGYDKYAISKNNYEALNSQGTKSAILMQAKVASGPKPTQIRVVE